MTEMTTKINGDRASNALTEIENHFRNGEALDTGNLAKVLHLVEDPIEKAQLRVKILKAQVSYWQDWWEFRCMPAGVGEPNFDDVISLLPVRREFVDFMDLQNDTFIVDLMAGSANMAPYFQETGKLAGYVGIDSNSLVERIAKERLSKLGVKHLGFVLHDLSEGLPRPQLALDNTGVNPKAIQYASMWGITYLEAESFISLVKQCLELSTEKGIYPELSFCMITNGSFDPQVLRRKFWKEVFPGELRKFRFRQLLRAGKAIPKMMEFGKTFREISPTWYPDEIISLLDNAGLRVKKVDDTLLWGQSTAIKVRATFG